ncbi:ABC transporter ATP-binding protein [Streptomyces triticiradicis]|uniref:ABC transporter ATP-binding protein n=2 Tax=Streptomyces triticiradicis TaxID=2651189 RepID=A0A7J5D7I2_9ACTN|nr:ABC transporter ATP-binding protein [Streptomyces triticiradicis]
MRYQTGGRVILDAVDLTVKSGESVAISGPSGSGKSTLLMCALGLLKPVSGTVHVHGERIDQLPGRRLLKLRRESFGIVFQAGELLPELTPVENVAIAALLSNFSRNEAFTRAEELLAELGVPITSTDTGTLSGGEQQRVAVARALINRPSIILADEPTGALDTAAREAVSDLLFGLPSIWECGLVVVTHDQKVAARAQRRLLLQDGLLIPAAEPSEIGAVS